MLSLDLQCNSPLIYTQHSDYMQSCLLVSVGKPKTFYKLLLQGNTANDYTCIFQQRTTITNDRTYIIFRIARTMEVSYTIFLFESAHPWGYYNSKILLEISCSSFFLMDIGHNARQQSIDHCISSCKPICFWKYTLVTFDCSAFPYINYTRLN